MFRFHSLRNSLKRFTSTLSATNPYALSADQIQLKQLISSLSTKYISPHTSHMDSTASLQPQLIHHLFSNGLMSMQIPSIYNGLSSSFLSTILAIEELAKSDPSVSVFVDVQNTLVNSLFITYASTAQQSKYLTMLSNETVGSFCLSESESGSDAFALQTSAVLSNDKSNYVLNGSKLWITNAHEANVFLVFANTTPGDYRGITCFIVERGMNGFSIGKKQEKVGIRASSTCPLYFDGVCVPVGNVLGKVGEGYKYAISILNEGRIGIAAQMIGLAQGVYDITLPYILQRKQFGQSVATFQGMQQQYAQLAAELESVRLLTYHAARLKDSGVGVVKEAAMAKLLSSQVAEKIASKCIEWCGGVGFTSEFGVEKYWRDSKIGAIYEGTSNIQLATIAKCVMKEYETQ